MLKIAIEQGLRWLRCSNWILSEQFQQFIIEVSVSIVEAPFALFKMQVKGMSRYPVELLQAPFGKAPKAFDAVDVTLAASKLVAAMLDPKMPGITNVHQTVIAVPAVAVDRRLGRYTASDNGLQRGFFAVRHDFGVNPAASFEQAKHRSFAGCATTPFASHAARAKVTFIHFDLTARKRRFSLTSLGNAPSDFEINAVHRFGRQAGQSGGISSAQIAGEAPRQAAKPMLGNP